MCILWQAYVRSFRRVYEDEIRVLLSEARAVLSRGGFDVKKPGLLAKMGSNTDILRSHLSGSLQVLSPAARAGSHISQSVADFSSSSAFASSPTPDHPNRPK